VNSPQVLLLDEPLGALDLKLRKQMQLELKRIQLEVGITFIYVTHDQEEAMTMSNRLAVMRLGHVEQIGAPEDVYEDPATEFVAGFLGASNLLSGKVTAKDGDVATIDLDVGVVVRAPDTKHSVGSTVKVGVRPEKITIQKEEGEAPAGRNSVTGLLEISAYIGVSNQYKVVGPADTILTVYAQNLGEEAPPQPGDRVRLTWRPEHTFVVTPAEVPISDEEEVIAP
jgi:spermidine/putrescine transport system ATP-binding protein